MKNKSHIVIVDYGVGNLHSLARAFMKCGVTPIISEEATDILEADGVVLPGVGAFAAGIHGLNTRGLVDVVKEVAARDTPMLGICLGAQLLLSEGHEFGVFPGLGIIPGKVAPFPPLPEKEKIPHIGWNGIVPGAHKNWSKTVLEGLTAQSQVYFVHSYVLEPALPERQLASTVYGGYSFCSAVQKGQVFGVQFHPEKSGVVGLRIISNFVTLAS